MNTKRKVTNSSKFKVSTIISQIFLSKNRNVSRKGFSLSPKISSIKTDNTANNYAKPEGILVDTCVRCSHAIAFLFIYFFVWHFRTPKTLILHAVYRRFSLNTLIYAF